MDEISKEVVMDEMLKEKAALSARAHLVPADHLVFWQHGYRVGHQDAVPTTVRDIIGLLRQAPSIKAARSSLLTELAGWLGNRLGVEVPDEPDHPEQIARWLESLARRSDCPTERRDWYEGVAADIRLKVYKTWRPVG